MKNTAVSIIAFIIVIVALIALAFVLELGGLKWKEYFAPKHQNVERKVFLETHSYNQGKMQDLTKYRLEYLKAKSAQDLATMQALRSTIQHQFADYDRSKLTPELEAFLTQEIFN